MNLNQLEKEWSPGQHMAVPAKDEKKPQRRSCSNHYDCDAAILKAIEAGTLDKCYCYYPRDVVG